MLVWYKGYAIKTNPVEKPSVALFFVKKRKMPVGLLILALPHALCPRYKVTVTVSPSIE